MSLALPEGLALPGAGFKSRPNLKRSHVGEHHHVSSALVSNGAFVARLEHQWANPIPPGVTVSRAWRLRLADATAFGAGLCSVLPISVSSILTISVGEEDVEATVADPAVGFDEEEGINIANAYVDRSVGVQGLRATAAAVGKGSGLGWWEHICDDDDKEVAWDEEAAADADNQINSILSGNTETEDDITVSPGTTEGGRNGLHRLQSVVASSRKLRRQWRGGMSWATQQRGRKPEVHMEDGWMVMWEGQDGTKRSQTSSISMVRSRVSRRMTGVFAGSTRSNRSSISGSARGGGESGAQSSGSNQVSTASPPSMKGSRIDDDSPEAIENDEDALTADPSRTLTIPLQAAHLPLVWLLRPLPLPLQALASAVAMHMQSAFPTAPSINAIQRREQPAMNGIIQAPLGDMSQAISTGTPAAASSGPAPPDSFCGSVMAAACMAVAFPQWFAASVPMWPVGSALGFRAQAGVGNTSGSDTVENILLAEVDGPLDSGTSIPWKTAAIPSSDCGEDATSASGGWGCGVGAYSCRWTRGGAGGSEFWEQLRLETAGKSCGEAFDTLFNRYSFLHALRHEMRWFMLFCFQLQVPSNMHRDNFCGRRQRTQCFKFVHGFSCGGRNVASTQNRHFRERGLTCCKAGLLLLYV